MTTFEAMRKAVFIFAAAGLLLQSCKNDFEVNEPWRETMVVVGLLNAADTAHYIKINKAYLGEGNALVMAGEFDSINYTDNEIDARLERWKNGVLMQTLPLYRDTLIPKDTGVFASPLQMLYKTSSPILQDGSSYKLIINNENSGKVVTSETPIVQNISVNTPNPNQTINLVGVNPYSTKFYTAAEGKRYEVVVRFHYTEKLIFDTTQQERKHVDIFLGTYEAADLSGGQLIESSVTPEVFYKTIGNNVQPNGNVNLYYNSLEFIYSAAAEVFVIYMDVAQTQSATFGEMPFFTNISDGVGLFSSRFNKYVNNVRLSAASYDSLRFGQYTVHQGWR